MSRYERGASFERQLVTEFWERGWAAMRAAGSGTRKEPVPDVTAIKGGRIILVECKTTRKDRLSLKTAITELARFAEISGGEGYIAIRFFRQRPRFYSLRELLNKEDFTICDRDEYLTMETMLGEQAKLCETKK